MIASAILLMAVRRSITLFLHASSEITSKADFSTEIVALIISVLMVIGIYQIAPLFWSIKQSEEKIKESHRVLTTLISNLPGIAFRCRKDDDWTMEFISDACKEITGYSVSDLVGNHTVSYAQLIHPEDCLSVKTAIEKALQEERPFELRYRLKTASGEERWIWEKGRGVSIAGEKDEFLEGFMIDITDQKQAEKQLRFLAHLLENVRESVVATDLNGHVIYWGKGAEALYGYRSEETMGKPITFIVEPNEKTQEKARMQQVKEKGVWKGQYVQKRKDDTLFWADTVISLMIDEQGDPCGFIGIDRDISDHIKEKEARESLRRLAQRLTGPLQLREISRTVAKESRTLFNHDLFWLCVIDDPKKGLLEYYVEDITLGHEFSHEECKKTDIDHIMNNKPCLINEFEEGFSSEFHPFSDTLRKPRSLISVPIRWEGQVIGMLSVQSDEPNRYCEKDLELLQTFADQCSGAYARLKEEEKQKKFKEHLQQAHKMEAIGQLASGVAHDFNNLLMVISGYSTLALQKLGTDNPISINIMEISKAGERASSLTRQLLAFSRKQVLQLEVLDINVLIRGTEKMLRRLIGEDIKLTTHLTPTLWKVKADATQMEQIIMNLAVNARDAMPNGGKLTIETANVELDEEYVRQHAGAKAGSYAMLAITDSGCGMDQKIQKRIFEPFFTTKERDKGTGLGLSSVYGIVKQSGGCIYAYSEPGKGTTFKVYLPCTDNDVEPPKQVKPTIESFQGTETVLLVEDDASVRVLVSRILSEYGYTVLEAESGEEAIKLCQHHKESIQLLLTDVIMTGMNGRELSARLSSFIPQLKTLFMSGYPDNAIVHHGVLKKGIAFIQKPVTADILVRQVRKVLNT